MKKKTPDTTKAASSAIQQEGSIVPVFAYPDRKNSVTAEVLATLLEGERMTGIDAVSESSTTRLAAITHYLRDRYSWPIEKESLATGCRDGRVTWVVRYFMHPDVIGQAMKDGAAQWMQEVRQARKALRAKVGDAMRRAKRLNGSGKAKQYGQTDYFEEVAGV